MKYVMNIFIVIFMLFALIIIYQNKIAPNYYKNELDKKYVYHKIKNDIKKGMSREEVYDILNNKKIKYHDDKNRDIDISGEGVIIEIDKEEKVYEFMPY